MNCYIFCLAIIPMVLCSAPALNDGSKIMSCPDCKKFPSENSNYTDFTVILEKKNTPTFFVGIRDGVLQMTMDGNLIHNISIPSKENDYKTCMYSVKQGIEKECGNIIGAIIPLKENDLMLACGNNADQTEQCWKINETNVVGKPNSYSFYSKNPERKYVISDPFTYQGFVQVSSNERDGQLLKADIYKTQAHGGQTLSLILSDFYPQFVDVYEFGDYIYYFFTDLSQEQIADASRVTYARVGRLCKYDLGGDNLSPSGGNFQTFSEARLLCPTTSGRDKFQFNILEFTSVISGNDGEIYIYGLFRAAKPADNLLAVCRYSLTEIEKAFSNDKYYEISAGSTMKVVTAAAYDSRHKTCDASLNTKATTHHNYREYKKRLIHVSVVSPDGGKLVITRDHVTIKDMLAESVTIAKTSYDIVRLFDSYLMYELFVPTSFFKEKNVETILSVRKISEESLTVEDVAKIKFTGVESPVASSSVPTSAATTANKVDISSTPKPSSTPRSSESASSPSTTMTGNLTATSNRTMLGNVSTTSPNTSSDQETTASPSTKHVPAVPTTLVTSAKPRTTSAMASVSLPSSWDRYIGQERIIVAAKERLLFVPIASCGALTCRECIEAMTPYCAWKNGHCVQLNSTENGAYKQDIKNGDYSKLCPKVSVTCKLVQVSKLIPYAGVTLQCSPAGVPTARVSYWSKDDKRLSNNSDEGVTINGGELKIRSYTLATAGKYTCHVINNGTSNSCSVEIPGSLPKISCNYTKIKTRFLLSCSVTGYPLPKMVLRHGERKVEGVSTAWINGSQEFQFEAINTFLDFDVGDVYKIVISKSLEFQINDVPWDEELSKTGSVKYNALEKQVMQGINALYKDNELFQDAEITFSKGSVIATVKISGLKTPTSTESNLTRELEAAIQGKKLGDLTISEPPDTTTKPPDQQSTPTPRSPSAREGSSPPAGKQTSLPTSLPTRLTSTRLPSTRLPGTRKPIFSSRPVVEALGTESVAHTSSTSGVPVWLLFLLLILISLIVFFVGYFCGVRGFRCSKLYGRSRGCTKDSAGSEDATEMPPMSRSEKTRESERNLLDKPDGKRQTPSKKSTPSKMTNHEGKNNVSKDGSVEIEQPYNSEEDNRPGSNHSTC